MPSTEILADGSTKASRANQWKGFLKQLGLANVNNQLPEKEIDDIDIKQTLKAVFNVYSYIEMSNRSTAEAEGCVRFQVSF
jgi:hypothetical protein